MLLVQVLEEGGAVVEACDRIQMGITYHQVLAKLYLGLCPDLAARLDLGARDLSRWSQLVCKGESFVFGLSSEALY
jgi:hypothetical protein